MGNHYVVVSAFKLSMKAQEYRLPQFAISILF